MAQTIKGDRYPARSEIIADGRIEVTIIRHEGGLSPSRNPWPIIGPFGDEEEARQAAKLHGATSFDGEKL